MSTTKRLVVDGLSHAPFSWTLNLAPWTTSDLAHTKGYLALIILYLGGPVLGIIFSFKRLEMKLFDLGSGLLNFIEML